VATETVCMLCGLTGGLEGLLGATGDGIVTKRSGGVTGGYRGRN
jgi:hypothetical protein